MTQLNFNQTALNFILIPFISVIILSKYACASKYIFYNFPKFTDY